MSDYTFVEVIKEYNRMCDYHKKNSGCLNCEIRKLAVNIQGRNCRDILIFASEKSQEIIMEWAKEYPKKTNEDKFEEVFGRKPNSRCPFLLLSECEGQICNNCPNYHFWQQEYHQSCGKQK